MPSDEHSDLRLGRRDLAPSGQLQDQPERRSLHVGPLFQRPLRDALQGRGHAREVAPLLGRAAELSPARLRRRDADLRALGGTVSFCLWGTLPERRALDLRQRVTDRTNHLQGFSSDCTTSSDGSRFRLTTVRQRNAVPLTAAGAGGVGGGEPLTRTWR